ncbi:MAG TPA: 1,6-anhydro-N-acetylmuramyl-L-alanine amidase AmpD [Gallionella sp.]|nr:1,6-anhydro-N-acetylmuramyl-L-alanine amidase AmpD [Gallionella sp.]
MNHQETRNTQGSASAANQPGEIDPAGLLVGCTYIPSPNCDDRPDAPIELLVIHNISLPPGEFGGDGVQQLFNNTLNPDTHPFYQGIAGLKVSSHFLIRRDGEIIQFVPCLKRAWHAGQSCWQGRTRCNDFSLGIELEGSDFVSFTDLQYAALDRLTRALRAAYPLRGIAGHSDIAPGRKTDPGPCFDWARYLTGLTRA